jgi:hypothetical protein
MLARMLPGSVNLEGSGGGVLSMTQAEWGGLLAHMPERNSLALRSAFLGDSNATSDLLDYLHLYAADCAIERKYGKPPTGSNLFEIMAVLAVSEVCLENRCQWCKGVAEIQDGDRVLQCEACKGTGKYRRNVKEALGHGEPWTQCYELVRAGLNAWILEGLEYVSKRIDGH